MEDLISHTNTHSKEEAELEDFGRGSLILGLRSLVLSNKFTAAVPQVDEIHPKLLKAQDVVGLSWLTCLCKIV